MIVQLFAKRCKLIFCREITLAEFNKLLEEVAPKYQKDNKLGSPAEAVTAMKEKICKNGPSTAGTTVSSNLLQTILHAEAVLVFASCL